MKLLVVGLAIFFGAHIVPWFPSVRARLVAKMGLGPYKGLFAFVALIGFAFIVLGKANAQTGTLYEPPVWGRTLALPLVLAGFLILPAAYIRSNMKRFTRHPMLWGVTLWALAHLLANGDLASVALFGSFLAYSLADMVSANRRGAQLSSDSYPFAQDLKVVAAGVLAYVMLLMLHGRLFGANLFL